MDMKKLISRNAIIIISLSFNLNLYGINDTIVLQFSNQRGYYEEPFVLTIKSSDPESVIKYTTDCSDPLSSKGKIYSSGLSITTTTIVKAIAYTSTDTSFFTTHTFLFPEKIKLQPKNPTGFPNTWGGSKIITADYEMDPEVIKNAAYSAYIIEALKSLPSLSLTMDVDEWFNHETGLYVGYPNSDITREKPVNAEFIYSDPEKNFLVHCGVQNQGGTSIINWKVPKQSMRLLFKSQYGPKKLNKEIFPDSDINSINTLVVDGFLYSWIHPWDNTQRKTALYFRDQLASNMQNSMGGLSFHGIYVNLYINGLYWGVYDLHERPDEEFMADYYYAAPEDFDIIKHNPNTIVAGSNESYKNLLTQARKGFASNESLETIKRHLDLPAFIDYMVLNFYLGNYDWAHQNYYAAVNKNLNSGYKFYTWDAEHVMRYSNVNYDCTEKNDNGGPTEIHQLLKQNPEYRLMFADAFYKHAYNNGALTPENFEKEFLKLKNEVNLAMILESARWGDYLESTTGNVYTKNDHWMPEVNKVINDYIPNRLSIVLQQLRSSDNLLFPNVMPPIFNKKQGMISKGEFVSLISNNEHSGEIIYTLDGTDPRKTGGNINGKIYMSPIKISKTTQIKARFRSSQNGEWSALVEGYFFPDNEYNALVITEIMYNSGYKEMEFVELLNNGATDINLKGYSFIKGIDYSFTNDLILNPRNMVVLSNNSEVFEEIYNFDPYDNYYGKLSNSGETLLLANYINEIVDSVGYSDNSPWPEKADGDGRSLELIDADKDNALAINWTLKKGLYGSPMDYTPIYFSASSNSALWLSVYPNPFTDGVFVQFKNFDNSNNTYIEVYNSFGQLVKVFNDKNPQQIFHIDLSELESGIYILKLLDNNNSTPQLNKVIIKLDSLF